MAKIQARQHSEIDGDGYYVGADLQNHRDPDAPMNEDVMLYQEPGPEPHRIHHYRAMSYIIAKSEADAKELEGNGWFRTTDAAHDAYLSAGKTTDEVKNAQAARKAEIERQMGEVDKKNETELHAYAGILQIPHKGMNAGQIKAAIRAKLETQ